MQKWRSYVVFAGSPCAARPLAVLKISQIPHDRFCSNSQDLCKKVLSSEPGGVFFGQMAGV